MHNPVLGEIWIKYQVAQFSRVLSTLLVGGIPLLQALDTAAQSLDTKLLQRALETAARLGEGRAVALGGAGNTKIFRGCPST